MQRTKCHFPFHHIYIVLFTLFTSALPTQYILAQISPTQSDTVTKINIQGTVRDHDGTPLAHVTVQVLGTQNQTQTDETGTYRLSQVDNNALLVFRMIGKKALQNWWKADKALMYSLFPMKHNLSTRSSSWDTAQHFARILPERLVR